MTKKTRVFFIVDCSGDTNREIFETLEEARAWTETLRRCGNKEDMDIRIGMVNNAYTEDDGGWNYEDLSDTFREDKESIIEKI